MVAHGCSNFHQQAGASNQGYHYILGLPGWISDDFSVPIFIESFSSYFHIPGSFLCNIGGHKKPPETAAFFFSLLFHTGHGSTGFSVLAASHQAGENMNDQTIIVCTSRLEN